MMQIREPYRDGIAVYHHPNPQIRSYLLDESISSMRVEHLKSLLKGGAGQDLKKLGPIGAQAAEEILKIEGIDEIRIKPTEVWVKKTEGTSWNEIEGKIINILSRARRRKKIRLITRPE